MKSTSISTQEVCAHVERTLVSKGYQQVNRKKFDAAKIIEQPIYAKRYDIGQSIYETEMSCDFIVFHPKKYKDCLIIETKWQSSPGSVDEKYPYLVLNIKNHYPHSTILVLDGEGYRPGAKKWIKSQIDNNLLKVFNMSEFTIWANTKTNL